jgi:hypothetical protein
VTRQEFRLRLSRPYPIGTSEDSEAMRKVSSHLLSPQIEQRLQGRGDRWVAAGWKDDSPSRLRQVGGIDPFHRTEVFDAHPIPPALQLSDVGCVRHLTLNDRRDVPELQRTEQVFVAPLTPFRINTALSSMRAPRTTSDVADGHRDTEIACLCPFASLGRVWA